MSFKITPRYVDHLWYPILVKLAGYHQIVEMQGKSVNAWNDRVEEQYNQDTKYHPRGWCV
jgi:hypothetical protein